MITLDLAGHGKSSSGQRNWTMEEYAKDVAAVIEATNSDNCIVIGHSMGGAVALELAGKYGDSIKAIVGVDSFTYQELYPQIPEDQIAAFMVDFHNDFKSTLRNLMLAYFQPNAASQYVEYMINVMASTSKECALASIENLLHWDVFTALECCNIPVVSINAERFLSNEVKSIYKNSLELVTIPDVGHFLMLDNAKTFNLELRKIMARFIKQL